jgi:hypothetical protein
MNGGRSLESYGLENCKKGMICIAACALNNQKQPVWMGCVIHVQEGCSRILCTGSPEPTQVCGSFMKAMDAIRYVCVC